MAGVIFVGGFGPSGTGARAVTTGPHRPTLPLTTSNSQSNTCSLSRCRIAPTRSSRISGGTIHRRRRRAHRRRVGHTCGNGKSCPHTQDTSHRRSTLPSPCKHGIAAFCEKAIIRRLSGGPTACRRALSLTPARSARVFPRRCFSSNACVASPRLPGCCFPLKIDPFFHEILTHPVGL